ncbi:hypothetical protein [Myxococcus sp. AM010]|uniref:hypothetical protein n=1 Tax=Myxococcus sp. AM010 TaxID=2745138 RepID=UPI0015961AD7|nr:hypothetical protein [Myxococcus sp. AM010]NVJ15177.1 hypothetical protein [Myxococcus sp. AM010]
MVTDILEAALRAAPDDASRAALYLRIFPFIVEAAEQGLLDFELTVMPLDTQTGAISTPSTPLLEEDAEQGLTFRQFAARAGVDRRTVGKHVIEVAPGPVPPDFPSGKVPGRRVGGVIRIFMSDLLRGQREERHAGTSRTPTGPVQGNAYHRQIALLRRRGRSSS